MGHAEEWRIVGRNDNYEVSSLGRVRRAKGYNSTKAGHILKPFLHKDGHLLVKLSRNGRATNAFVHALVCEAFHGPRPSPNHEVAHGDGRSINNAEGNLRWATRRENAQDAVLHGTTLKGSRNLNAQLCETDVRMIKMMIRTGQGDQKIARQFDVSRSAISNIRNNETWRHVP